MEQHKSVNFDFPIESVNIEFTTDEVVPLCSPKLAHPSLQVNDNEFYMDVINTARYRARNGNDIRIFQYNDADIASIKLFLNGSVLGAILHQRSMLPFHGSSFSFKEKGIIVCGYSGAGKSSVTAAFCQNGASFIADDITPVSTSDTGTHITPLRTQIKLWDDSLKKLKIENNHLEKIRPTIDKFYLQSPWNLADNHRLDHIIILSIHNKDGFEINEFNGMAKYNALRFQIYRKAYLKGMPDTEKIYFKQLLRIASHIKVTHIYRPQICDIYETMNFIKKEILQ